MERDSREKSVARCGRRSYYLLLALFPALAALVSVYGLVASPAGAAKSVRSLSGMLPPSTVELIGNELTQLASASSQSLGLGAIIGIAIALWSGVRGMTGMMTALNIAYDQPERRGFIRFYSTEINGEAERQTNENTAVRPMSSVSQQERLDDCPPSVTD